MSRPASSMSPVVFLLGACLFGSTCIPDPDPHQVLDQAEQAIVGGVNETGYPAVGAMTFVYPGYGYGGSFCSGTLVGSRWVLTAAHCMTEVGGIDLEANPQVIHFYVGSDANPGPSGWPSSGTLHQADAVFVHPQYNDQSFDNDIALVRLASPLTTVTPIAINQNSMTSSWIGDNVTYVGFGVSNGVSRTGGGVKRRGANPIHGVWPLAYQSNATGGVGVCFGDSGGPGLLMVDEVLRVVGVNSGVSAGTNPDPCLGYGSHTRVDAFVSGFLSPTMGTPPPNCQTNPAVCPCAAACQADGSCDNTACETLSCEEIWACMDGCGANDDGCVVGCYYLGTAAGRAAFDALQICVSDNCASASDMSACIGEHCMTEYYECLPPADCDITGGDCGAGEACYPAQGGRTDCFLTNGKTEGQACNPSLTDRLDCGDGLVCLNVGGGDLCMVFCTQNDHCGTGDFCHKPIFTGISHIGVCLCIDEDNDGYCQVDDCDDTDRHTNPGAAERCGDGKDNNCNGEIDEGCEACVDADGDGYCSDVDCDDDDPRTHPNAPEICGDGKDNNCDGQIDEDCPCVDADGDGYCQGTGPLADCDDTNPTVNPGMLEVCGNGRDDNCNGQVDEGCEEDTGCGCQHGAGSETALPVMLLVFGVWVLMRRRRLRPPF